MTIAQLPQKQEPEARGLRTLMSDLTSVLALSAVWSGKQEREIAERLAQTLASTLDLDLAYVALSMPLSAEIEAASAARARRAPEAAIGAQLQEVLGSRRNEWPLSAQTRLGDRDLSLLVTRIGLSSELGVIVAGSEREGFPSASDQLLLQVFANQTAVSIHEARLLGDRARAEGALRQSEAKLRAAVDGMPGLVAILNPDGSVESVNRQVLEYSGLSVDETKQWAFNGFFHDDDLPGFLTIFTESIAAGRAYQFEQRLRRHDGVFRWFDARGVPAHDDTGKLVAWYVLLTDIDDRKRAEQKLAESERSFRQTFDAIPTMAWCNRNDGSNAFLNQRWHDYTGLTPEEANGWGWQVALHPDDLPMLLDVWKELLTTGRPGELEARLRRHDGVYRWFVFRCDPLRNDAGDIVCWYGTNHDIDDSRRAESLLAGERHLLEMITSGQTLRDVLNALCELVEDAAADCYCDIHLIDWSGPTIAQSIAPSLPESYTKPIAGAELRENLVPCGIAANRNIQVISEDFDIDPRWCASPVRAHVREHGLKSVWSTPICSNSGGVLGTLCIYQRKPALPTTRHQDIIGRATHIASIAIERLRAEEDLHRSRTSLENAQHLTQTGSFSWNVFSDEVSASEQLRLIYEFDTVQNLHSSDIRGRTHAEDIGVFERALAEGQSAHADPDRILRLLMPDGRLKYVRAYARTITHPDGRHECVGAVQDVTHQHQLEETLNKVRTDLAHISRVTSLGTLTASIAHEVNQPLSGIITNANTCVRMLSAEPPNIEGALETARRTIRDGNRASEVITRLRALFRKTEFVSEPVCLHMATQEVIALSQQEMRRNRVMVTTAFAENAPTVPGDRVQLQQVILNLLLNAMDAMRSVEGRTRRVAIRTQFDDEAITLSVSDNGHALAPDDLARVFDAFYTTKEEGMGIGLSVSRSIIERHHGKLWAAVNDDAGMTFAFSLPRHTPA